MRVQTHLRADPLRLCPVNRAAYLLGHPSAGLRKVHEHHVCAPPLYPVGSAGTSRMLFDSIDRQIRKWTLESGDFDAIASALGA